MIPLLTPSPAPSSAIGGFAAYGQVHHFGEFGESITGMGEGHGCDKMGLKIGFDRGFDFLDFQHPRLDFAARRRMPALEAFAFGEAGV